VTSNNITILGTPTGPISTQTTFNYTVTTVGGNCFPASLLGTITVNPNDALALTSAVGSENQVLCDADSLNTIIYEFSEGATNASVSGLPVGVNALVTGNNVTISGTPPAATGTTQVYPYTVTTSGTCGDANLSGTITVKALVSVSAGTDGDICESSPFFLSLATATDSNIISWDNNGGDGTFNNSSILNPIYTPGSSDISLGLVDLTLTATDICGNNFTDTIRKDIVGNPTATAGTDITISQGATATLSGSSTNASSVLWTAPPGDSGTLVNPTSEIAQYISDPAEVGPVTLTLTAQPITVNGSPCGTADSNSLTIFINLPPTADAGEDRDICLNEVTQLGVPSTPGYSYVWTSVPTDTSINFPEEQSNPFVSPSVTTEYTVEVTDTNGETAENSVIVTVIPLPVVDAGSDDTICVGESIQLGAPAPGGFSYAWTSDPAGFTSTLADPIDSPIVTTRYFLTVTTNLTGCQDTADVVITVETPPVIDAGTPETICEDQPDFTLASATGPSSGVSYEWEALGGDGSFNDFTLLNPTYTIGPNDINVGSVTFRLTAQNITGGCSTTLVQNEVILTIVPEIEASVGVGGVICSTDSFQINATFLNYSSINWTSSGSPGTLSSNTIEDPIYTPSPSDIANGFVDITVTVSPLNPCTVPFTAPNPNATLRVNITEGPEIDLTGNYIICEDQNVQPIALVTDYVQITWSSNGDGFFIPANGLNTQDPIYVPGPLDISGSGPVTLGIEATGNGSCAPVTDQTLLTIEKNVEVDAGPSVNFCEGPNQILNASANNAATILWTTDGDGTFSNNGIVNPFYTPGPVDLVSGSVTLTIEGTPTLPCVGTNSSEQIFIIYPEPDISAGADEEICEGQNITLTTASGNVNTYDTIEWSTDGTGTFNDANIINPVYFPSQLDITSGTVRLTLDATQVECVNATDFMILTIVKEPTVDAVDTVTICQDGTANLSATATDFDEVQWSIVGGSGSGTILNGDSLNAQYVSTPSDTGPVFLTVTVTPNQANSTFCGGDVTDTTTIFIEASPLADAGPNSVICEGDNFTFDASQTSASNYSSFSWTTTGNGIFTNASTLAPTYTPGTTDISAGQVTLRLTANPNFPCTIPVIAEMVLTITKVPEVDAGINLSFCETTGSFTISDAVAAYYDTLEWTTSGTGIFTPSNDVEVVDYTPSSQDIAIGQIILTLTGKRDPLNCGAETSDSKIITFLKEPTAEAGDDQTICANDTAVLIDAVVTNEAQIVWTTSGTGSFSPNNQVLNPTYIPSPTDISNGTNIILTITASPEAPCAEEAQDTLTLIIDPLPTVDLGADFTICENDTVTFNLVDGVEVTNAATFSWASSGDGTFTANNILNPVYIPGSLDIQGPGPVTLTLTVLGNNTCDLNQSDSVDISIQKNAIADAGSDLAICEDGITITDATADHFSTLNWVALDGTGTITDPTTNTPTYVPSEFDINQGFVTLQLTASPLNPCSTAAVSEKILTISSLPIVNAGADAIICEGEDHTISGATASGFDSISWSSATGGTFINGTTLTPTYTPTAGDIGLGSVTLTLTATSVAPCAGTVTDEMVLTIQNQPDVEAGSNVTICEGDVVTTIDATVTGEDSTLWTTPDGDGTFNSDSLVNTTYTPGPQDIIDGFVTLVLTAEPIAPCATPITDFIEITIEQPAEITIIPSTDTICEDQNYTFSAGQVVAINETSILWTTNGSGTFLDNGTLTPTYNPSPADILNTPVILTATVTGSPACASSNSSATFTLNIDPLPTLDLSNSPTFTCFDSSIILDAQVTNNDTIAWEIISGTGSLLNADTLNPTYIPAIDSDIVIIEAVVSSLLPCTETVSDQITIEVISAPEFVSFPDDDINCDINPYNILGVTTNGNEQAYLWETTGTGSFSSTSVLEPEYTPSAADVTIGFVDLTLTLIADTNCSPQLDAQETFRLTITPQPTVDPGADDFLCEDQSYTVSDATATNGISYSWSSNTGSGIFINADTLNPTYTPGGADLSNGFFELILTVTGDAPCSAVTADEKRVDIILNPVLEVGPDQTTCADTPFLISITNAENYSSLQWTTSGNGTFSNPITENPSYTPGSLDLSNGNVILTLTADALAPCTDAIADSFVLNFIDFVEIEAGPDIESCEDDPIDILGTATNFTSVNWTTSGDGSFSDDISLQTTYTPGPNDQIGTTVILTLEAVGTPPCANQTDFLTVTFNERPSIDIGSDIIACENETVTFTDVIVQDFDTLQWITSGSGTLLDPTTASPTYIPGAGETGIVTFTLTVSPIAPCVGDEIVQKIIEYNASPTVNAGSDATLCEENGSYTIPDAQESNTNGIQWNAPSGDGTFVNDTSLTPTYTPGQNDYVIGFVELEITGFGLQACPSVTNSMILTLIPNAIVDAGPDSFICEGETFTITGSSSNTNDIFWTTTGLGTITGINTLTPTYTPATGEIGTILLTLNSNAIPPCLNEETSSMTLTIDAQPISEIDEDATICEDETYTFSGTISGDPSTTFSWSTTGSGNFVNTNTLTPTYTPSDGDATLGVVEFSLTAVSGGSCPDDVSTMSLFINKLPVVDAGVDVAICELDSYTLSDATVTNSSSLTWISSGTGTFSNPNILNPTYTPSQADIDNGSVLLTLEADADSPCVGTVSDSLTITFIDPPTVDAGPDTAICEGTYTVIGASASNDSSLLWTIVQGTGTLTSETTIAPIYTTSLGDVGVGQVILKLTVTGNTPCDLTVEDELVLDIQAEPTVDAGTDAQVCVDTSYTFLNGATSENTDSILWTHDGLGTLANPNSLTPTYTPSNGELGLVTFILTGTPFAPCSNEVQDDFVLEIIDFGTVNAGPDVTLCETTYQLDGTGTNINTINWTTSGTGTFSSSTILNPIYSASPEDVTAGSVVLTLSAETDPPCLGNISDSIILTFEETPIVDAGQDATICEGDSYILSEANTENTTTTLWTTNGDGVFDNPTTVNTTYNPGTNDVQNATVTLTLTGAGSPLCLDASDTIDLTITNTPSITIPSNVISWCSDNLPLIISGVSASNFTTVEWSTDGTGTFDNNNVLNPNYNPSSQDLINGVNLSVSVANGLNCPTVSETINVIFEENVSVSAGDDGLICENDTFQITNANTTASNFTWSSSGDGSFINDTTLSPIYTPGPLDRNSGIPVVISLTADNNNACPGSTSDSLLL
ncbi:hypothetical protein OAT87_01490, partial [Flavobacteriaceae bacterium]|nr:hypothetical protein [Flavobacteriaceae bacterium]